MSSSPSLRVQNIINGLQASQEQPFSASLPSSPKGFLLPALKRALSIRSQRKGLLEKQLKLKAALDSLHGEAGGAFDKVPLRCTRGTVFESSVDHILAATQKELDAGINVLFNSPVTGDQEAGIDSGGLTREWFHDVAAELTAHPGGAEASGGVASTKDTLNRFSSIAGTTQPMLTALPDNSLMLGASERPPAHYLCLGRVVAMCVMYNARDEAFKTRSKSCLFSSQTLVRILAFSGMFGLILLILEGSDVTGFAFERFAQIYSESRGRAKSTLTLLICISLTLTSSSPPHSECLIAAFNRI